MIVLAQAPTPPAAVSTETRNAGTETRSSRSIDTSRPSGLGVAVYAGLDTAFARSQSQRPSEATKNGFQVGIKALGTIFTNDVLLDLGGGYFYNRLAASSSAKDTITNSTSGTVTIRPAPQIVTRAGYFEFSPRFLFGGMWQAGAVGQVFFGTDATFGPDIREKKSTVLAGPVIAVAGGNDVLWRIGLQGLTDVNLLDRQVYIAQLNLQIGLPIVRQVTIVKQHERIQKREEVTKRRIDKTVDRVFIKEVVRLMFESEVVNFETNSAKLSAQSDKFLTDVGKFIADNPELWGSLVVEGHTDARGPRDHNVKLSQQRADSVRMALIRGGAAKDKIKALGIGPDKLLDPADTPLALARNRRVELNFSDVKDAEALKEGIAEIRKRLAN